MSKQFRFTDAEIEKMIELRKTMALNKVGEAFGLSGEAIRLQIKRYHDRMAAGIHVDKIENRVCQICGKPIVDEHKLKYCTDKCAYKARLNMSNKRRREHLVKSKVASKDDLIRPYTYDTDLMLLSAMLEGTDPRVTAKALYREPDDVIAHIAELEASGRADKIRRRLMLHQRYNTVPMHSTELSVVNHHNYKNLGVYL